LLRRQHRVIWVWSQQLWEGQALTYHLCSIDHHKLDLPRPKHVIDHQKHSAFLQLG
jgi:hypothetical protein